MRLSERVLSGSQTSVVRVSSGNMVGKFVEQLTG